MMPRLALHWLQGGLLVLGLLLLGLWSWTFFESRAFQAAGSKKLEAALRDREAGPPAAPPGNATLIGTRVSDPPKPATEDAGLIGRVEIPRLRITAIVAEGSDDRTLRRAVGHIPSTALPGDPGNCALAGHRDTFLRGLGGVRVNDVIRIVAPERTCTYQVEWTAVVEPQRVDVLDSTATRALTLITCFPFTFVGHAPQRFIVRARQVDAATGDRPGQDRDVPSGLRAPARFRHAGVPRRRPFIPRSRGVT
jgi:sortase A